MTQYFIEAEHNHKDLASVWQTNPVIWGDNHYVFIQLKRDPEISISHKSWEGDDQSLAFELSVQAAAPDWIELIAQINPDRLMDDVRKTVLEKYTDRFTRHASKIEQLNKRLKNPESIEADKAEARARLSAALPELEVQVRQELAARIQQAVDHWNTEFLSIIQKNFCTRSADWEDPKIAAALQEEKRLSEELAKARQATAELMRQETIKAFQSFPLPEAAVKHLVGQAERCSFSTSPLAN